MYVQGDLKMKIRHIHPDYTNETNIEKRFNLVYGDIIQRRNKRADKRSLV
jgi:hypothetical protein